MEFISGLNPFQVRMLHKAPMNIFRKPSQENKFYTGDDNNIQKY